MPQRFDEFLLYSPLGLLRWQVAHIFVFLSTYIFFRHSDAQRREQNTCPRFLGRQTFARQFLQRNLMRVRFEPLYIPTIRHQVYITGLKNQIVLSKNSWTGERESNSPRQICSLLPGRLAFSRLIFWYRR